LSSLSDERSLENDERSRSKSIDERSLSSADEKSSEQEDERSLDIDERSRSESIDERSLSSVDEKSSEQEDERSLDIDERSRSKSIDERSLSSVDEKSSEQEDERSEESDGESTVESEETDNKQQNMSSTKEEHILKLAKWRSDGSMGYSSWKTSTIATLYQHGVSDAVDVNTMVACPTQSEYEAIVAKEAAGTALLASEEHKKKLHYANRIVAPAILAAMTNDATGSALCSNSMSSDYPAGKAWLMMKDLAERHQPSSTTAKTDCKTLVRKIDCDLDDTPVMEMHDEFIKTNAKFDVAARTSDSDFLEMMLEKCKDTGYAKILRDEIGKTSPNLLNAAKEIKSLQDPILNARGKKKGNYKNNGEKEVQLANSSKNKSNKPNDKTKKGNGKKDKNKSDDNCRKCGKPGHYRKDCWEENPEKAPTWYRERKEKKKDKETANAHVDNFEVTLTTIEVNQLNFGHEESKMERGGMLPIALSRDYLKPNDVYLQMLLVKQDIDDDENMCRMVVPKWEIDKWCTVDEAFHFLNKHGKKKIKYLDYEWLQEKDNLYVGRNINPNVSLRGAMNVEYGNTDDEDDDMPELEEWESKSKRSHEDEESSTGGESMPGLATRDDTSYSSSESESSKGYRGDVSYGSESDKDPIGCQLTAKKCTVDRDVHSAQQQWDNNHQTQICHNNRERKAEDYYIGVDVEVRDAYDYSNVKTKYSNASVGNSWQNDDDTSEGGIHDRERLMLMVNYREQRGRNGYATNRTWKTSMEAELKAIADFWSESDDSHRQDFGLARP